MNAFVASELDIHGNVVSRRVVNSDRICSMSVESASPSIARVFMKNGDVFRFPVEGRLKDLIEGKWPPPIPPKPYDAEIEYLESTGTQYIDTGVYLQSSDTVSMRADAPFAINEALWSARNLGEYPWVTFTLFRLGGTDQTIGRFDYGKYTKESTDINTEFDFSEWSGVHEYKAVANKLYIDDILYATGKADQFTTGGPVRLLASESTRNFGDIVNFFHGKVYGFRGIRNGTTVMDLIPVRVGSVGYLYDKVSGQLFGNAGTGEFVIGPDVVDPPPTPYDAEVEYVEGTGTQYVDTGLDYFPEYEIGAVVPDAVGNNTLGIDQSWKLGRHSAAEPVWRASINGVNHPTTVSCGTYADMSYHGAIFKCNSDTLTVLPNQYAEGTMVLFSTGAALPLAYPLRLYYCRLFDQNGVLIRDYTPVRVGAVGYLYDRANPTGGPLGNGLYGSATDTPLIAGPDVVAT